MRYKADTQWEPRNWDDRSHANMAVVVASERSTMPIALRHARAMAAVLRSAKAWGACPIETTIESAIKLEDAIARLVAVEKEVKRGQ